MTANSLIDRFVAEAERTDAQVHRDAAWDAVADLALSLAGDGPIAVAPSAGVPADVMARFGDLAVVPTPENALETVLDAPVGIVRGRAAIAETGSVLLIEDSIADRMVSMLTRTLIEVVPPDVLLPDLFALREHIVPIGGASPRYAALVTGPSRTADIERSLTIGVQGPSDVHVVLLA
jgi:L-lactate utilization protein LutC